MAQPGSGDPWEWPPVTALQDPLDVRPDP